MPQLLLPLPAPQADHQLACLVMVDLVGSTALAHTLALDHYMALMTEFVQVLILSFEARGGQVLQHQGDAVLALWPAGQVESAVLAALEAHERAGRLGLAGMLGIQLQVRGGVALGRVITGVVGGQTSAYGLPVNYARRLCDAAEAGETLVCGEVGPHVTGGVRLLPRALPPLRGFGPDCRAYTAWPPKGTTQTQMKTG